MRSQGLIRAWTETIYEPEARAFGGTEAMDLAHRLFHDDSRYILEHLHHVQDKRRELSILLCGGLMHAAQQDWYEQGEVWARVGEHRSADVPPPASTNAAAMKRLLTVDTGPDSLLVKPGGSLHDVAAWIDSFRRAGRDLHDPSKRGMRGVLAHHLLFNHNRLGLSYVTQARIAATARHVVFGPRDDTSPDSNDAARA